MPQSTKEAISERRAKVSKLYRQGYSQYEIARQVGVSQALICQDIQAVRKQWRESSIRDFDALQEEQLQKIDLLEQTYWAEWERSQKNRERKSTKAKGTKDIVTGVEKTEMTEGRLGDPRYLAGVQWCISRRVEILGLDAPKKIEHTFPALDRLSPDQLEQLRLLQEQTMKSL